MSAGLIMPQPAARLQSTHACIRRKAGRTGTLRDHDGRAPWPSRRHHGRHHRRHGLVGQHGVYCQSQRWPGKPVMDIQIIMKSLTDAKELIQSVMEELKRQP